MPYASKKQKMIAESTIEGSVSVACLAIKNVN